MGRLDSLSPFTLPSYSRFSHSFEDHRIYRPNRRQPSQVLLQRVSDCKSQQTTMKAAMISALAALGAVTASPTKPTDLNLSKREGGLTPVTTKGNAFYTGDKRWYMRGIDYQPGGAAANIDPLADPDICLRDIKEFKDLGVNTIRVYAVDNKKDHDECMKALDDAGIYLVLDVNNAQYDNVAAFFSGNEVINDEEDTDKAAPYVKAVTRDMKNYMAQRGLRQVPVGYSAADVSENRQQTADYFNCGSDDMRSDFFAFNDYGLPIFLSEWGCIKNRPREFEELGALMSDKMTGVYSGGLMYEYSLEDNDYGIVKIEDGKVNRQKEFSIFKEALEKYTMPTGDGGASSKSHAVDCPPKDPSWQVDPEMIPEMPEEAQKYMKNGAGEGPGLDGSGSQQAGDSGTATASVSEGVASPTADSQQTDSSDDEDAAGSMKVGFAPLLVTGATLFFTAFGALLL